MRQAKINLYGVNELQGKAKEKAIDNHRYLLVEDNWWDWTYEDAAMVGVRIKDFDLDQYWISVMMDDYEESAKLIKANHGNQCGSFVAAAHFLESKMDVEDMRIFMSRISRYYLDYLKKEYEYLTSDGHLEEYLSINKYEFTETGDTWEFKNKEDGDMNNTSDREKAIEIVNAFKESLNRDKALHIFQQECNMDIPFMEQWIWDNYPELRGWYYNDECTVLCCEEVRNHIINTIVYGL